MHLRPRRMLPTFFLLLMLLLCTACTQHEAARSQRPVTQATLPPTATAQQPLPKLSPYGIAAGGWYGEDPTQLATRMKDVAHTGASRIRMDFSWPTLEPSQDGYTWTAMDQEVTAAKAQGLTILGILAYTPSWARAPGCVNPPNPIMCAPQPAAFADFAKVTAHHYLPYGVEEWEIENEENSSSFWYPRPDPASYVDLLKVTYTAIKSIDKAEVVISGGLAPNGDDNGCSCAPDEYFAAMLPEGVLSSLDAVGMHPNTYTRLPSQDQGGTWTQMIHIHNLISSAGSTKPVWITELSAPSGPDVSAMQTPQQQADILRDGLTLARSYDWVQAVYVFTLYDYASDSVEGYFGLLDINRKPKPAYSVFKAFTAA